MLGILFTLTLARKLSSSTLPMVAPVQITSASLWSARVTQAIQADPYAGQLLPFHLAWMQLESGGNPAAIGANGKHGPDGFPLEIGLYQAYNPDDFDQSKIGTPAQFRAYCKNSLYRPEAEKLTRDLTDEEKGQQIRMGVYLVNKGRRVAGLYLAKVGAHWDAKAGPDFWMMAKLNHALPGLVKALVPVAKKLGHPPASWSEFRQTLGTLTQVELADNRTWGYRSDWDRLLNIAESVGGVVKGFANV